MKGNSRLYLVIYLLIITSCGREVIESTSAPKTKDQVGIIASCTSRSEAESIAQELGVKFRVINEKRKIIEFIGIKQEELEAYLPKSKFRQNKIYNEVLIAGGFEAKTVANYEYYGPHSPQYGNESLTRYFPHLEQINAFGHANKGEGVTIAIIDTGVYYNHPHLSPNIKTNENDKHGSAGNGRDDDGNGHADDYVGWDFYNGDAYPIDDNGHGTHVAGLAASTYMGVAPKAKILPIKVLGADGRGDLGTIAAGIMYALDRGADMINLSLGGSASSEISAEIQALINTINMAKTENALIIAAAGNGGADGIGDCNDNLPVYPANIQEDNLLAVAAVDQYNELTEYSNFGGATVHVAAPGGDYYTGALVSTGIPDCSGPCSADDTPYRGSMGTSMATPIVSGLAAVLKSKNLNLSYKVIREAILKGGRHINALEGLIQSSMVVNVAGSLQEL